MTNKPIPVSEIRKKTSAVMIARPIPGSPPIFQYMFYGSTIIPQFNRKKRLKKTDTWVRIDRIFQFDASEKFVNSAILLQRS
ncbi:MAG: hypothetical protein D6B25_11140 [Desulfobulbaceae bacterium]|nr:MAG: hypothetical protein D6B25_11140 [Desulfobulbaceae bacterium]